jgi:hypothetical protein
VMTDSNQPDRFAIIVTPEVHEQITNTDGQYPLVGTIEPDCRNVIAQRDPTGGWDITPKNEPIVINTINITEQPTSTTTTHPPTTNDPCNRLAATQDD